MVILYTGYSFIFTVQTQVSIFSSQKEREYTYFPKYQTVPLNHSPLVPLRWFLVADLKVYRSKRIPAFQARTIFFSNVEKSPTVKKFFRQSLCPNRTKLGLGILGVWFSVQYHPLEHLSESLFSKNVCYCFRLVFQRICTLNKAIVCHFFPPCPLIAAAIIIRRRSSSYSHYDYFLKNWIHFSRIPPHHL